MSGRDTGEPGPGARACGSVSTHVLDAVRGVPAAGIEVALHAGAEPIARATTDDDGRVPELAAGLAPGTYRLVFATGAYFAARGQETFYPEVSVTFATGPGHHHVPLLLSPFAFSTYRGS
ncbi:MAG TPA: hydroxyisourate hydrolase [Nocardia sp.]|uniref:hydroxyisourate hydrolase n=1 Tax=Nocardia TaxID=1817 RepID=UPI00245688BA|nr:MULTISPECIES: hydroxyisourate hydrolase [Nocardia]HLS79586.1 hydroxyisourate hydrolase [Nocardia sp.]